LTTTTTNRKRLVLSAKMVGTIIVQTAMLTSSWPFFFKYICTILGVFWHAGMKFVLVKTSRFCPAQVLTVFLLECLMDISNAPPAHDGELYVSSCAKLMTNNNYMCIQWSWYRAGEPSRGERVRNRCHERISALFVAVLMYDEQRKLI